MPRGTSGVSVVAVMVLAAGVLVTGAMAPGATAAGRRTAVATPQYKMLSDHAFSSPPTMADCQQLLGYTCYQPGQIEVNYGMPALYAHHLDGRGATICIVDSYGSPTIQSDLKTFDTAFDLPAPPSFKIITPAGSIPPYDPSNTTMVGWAVETSLDVEYSHAMAPGANIVLAETPVAETIGVAGFPQMIQAENYMIARNMCDVISQSFAAAEQTFPDAQSLLNLRSAYINAAGHGVTVLGAAGDDGTSSPSNAAGTTYFTSQVVNWPASDPLVTAVGGTQLHLGATGAALMAPNVWNDTNWLGSPAAGSGGVSTIFGRPAWQDGVKGIVGNRRGLPDVAMSAAVDGGVLVYASFAGLNGPGYYVIGGTSEASPEFAGVVAVADEDAGHPLGDLNPTLYSLAASGAPGIVPIATGNNTVTFAQGGQTYTVPGYEANGSYSLTDGLGTVDAAALVPELVASSSS